MWMRAKKKTTRLSEGDFIKSKLPKLIIFKFKVLCWVGSDSGTNLKQRLKIRRSGRMIFMKNCLLFLEASQTIPANISTLKQYFFNVLDRRNDVDLMLKMKKNSALDFQRYAVLIQLGCPMLKQRWNALHTPDTRSFRRCFNEAILLVKIISNFSLLNSFYNIFRIQVPITSITLGCIVAHKNKFKSRKNDP